MFYAFEYADGKNTTYATMPDKVAGAVHTFETAKERDEFCDGGMIRRGNDQKKVEATTVAELRKMGWNPYESFDFVA